MGHPVAVFGGKSIRRDVHETIIHSENDCRMADEDFRAVTPLIHSHVNPYGSFELDMAKRLPLDVPVEVVVQ